jgi:hypothetical protein
MSKLAFLTAISVIAQDEPKKKNGGGGARKEWNPTEGLAIRIWNDGSVFPSQQLVDYFDLKFRNKFKDEEVAAAKETKTKLDLGMGFDIVDTQEFPVLQTPTRLLFISPVHRSLGKVDLFGSVSYNEIDGTPLYNVMTQGATTFGKSSLIPKIEEIYGVVFGRPAVEAKEAVAEERDAEGKITTKAKPAIEAQEAIEGPEYVDMVLVANPTTKEPWTLPSGKAVAFLPKTVSRGEKKGETTVERRENPVFYAFLPKSMVEEPEQVAPAPSNGTTK